MTNTAKFQEILRDKIIAKPETVLEDPDVMYALIAANERQMGTNIVDLRGIAMERLATRLDRLEETHRSVIAAAYDNLAGTNQIHRAILRMLNATKFEDFLHDLNGDVAEILRVDSIRLVLETAQEEAEPAVKRLGEALTIAEPGIISAYLGAGREENTRPVVLRQIRSGDAIIYGDAADDIRSEAALRLDFGNGRLPGMLAMGSEDPHLFKPSHGTDLLTFFGGVFERAMRRWLS